MKLEQILAGVDIAEQTADAACEIGELKYDSRQVEPGDVFVAITGFETDGHRYIGKAIELGARVIVCEYIPEGGIAAPYVRVASSRRALAQMAANYFGHPADRMTMVGITGTNGKTTTTYLLKTILEAQGHRVGLIGTNQNMIGDEILPTERTTPESFELQRLFAQMRDAGCSHVLMEVSSHSLVLDRVYGITFAVGAFTNLTQDHLDFHKTMEAYRDAKAMLFRQSAAGVMNRDDADGRIILAEQACPFLTYGEQAGCDLCAQDIQLHADSIQFNCVAEGACTPVSLGIPGQFTVYNALCALACAKALGISIAAAAAALRTAHGVKGRVEVVPTNTDYTVLIDYAHSPDGVENVLRAARGFTKGRLIGLFGCGGDRDRTKRPKMGAIAAQLSDLCIVTSDNPRTEQPEAIIDDILAGMQETATPYEVIVNRPEAIWHALDIARPGDTIVLMGKGHETYQEINHVKHHLDEREVVAAYFEQKK
ncbi:MAG TPA: UDP-N-acetylmuramoyl-L-alanyl-D-glutamate--2,6-diaminopimelate ligase [Candidatus Butyricicoccus stercorigallinarum]|nr:UDP-N-acetylmuramoyl-L-alanyl-D-glutamate--2,6-diaminopimelate ligase [Candidatus Butyricicoccus stercorigallinarum]